MAESEEQAMQNFVAKVGSSGLASVSPSESSGGLMLWGRVKRAAVHKRVQRRQSLWI